MRYSILFPLVAVAVISSGATFFITKSVCSNSESQVVAYFKAKEAEAEKQRAAAQEARHQMIDEMCKGL